MTSTTTVYGSAFSEAEQLDGIYGYINGAEYDLQQSAKMVPALLSAMQLEVDERLAPVAHWTPSTSEFVHEVGAELPDYEEMKELFEDAWRAVEVRYDEIETEALA